MSLVMVSKGTTLACSNVCFGQRALCTLLPSVSALFTRTGILAQFWLSRIYILACLLFVI